MASTTLWERKRLIRLQAHARRRAQPDKDAFSARILARFTSLPEYEKAGTVMFYVDVRSEVRTRPALAAALASGKRIVVPYCNGPELGLFHLTAMDQLAPAGFGLLEPRGPLRDRPDSRVEPGELDVVLVPGVAFDSRGARLGHGKGYYDRLLVRLRPGTPLIAPAFQCQIFPEIPTEPHDVFMDAVITEQHIYRREAV